MVALKSDMMKLKKGDSAPDFYLMDTQGDMVSLSQFKDKIAVVIFMCNHCPYVKPKMKEIVAIQDDYEKKGVVVMGINSNDPNYDEEDSYENMQKVAKSIGLKYYLFDENQDTARDYGATCTPDPFVFDKDHSLIYHGRINDAMNPNDTPKKHDMREVLDNLLAGKPMEKWFEPSMGCSIKWK